MKRVRNFVAASYNRIDGKWPRGCNSHSGQVVAKMDVSIGLTHAPFQLISAFIDVIIHTCHMFVLFVESMIVIFHRHHAICIFPFQITFADYDYCFSYFHYVRLGFYRNNFDGQTARSS